MGQISAMAFGLAGVMLALLILKKCRERWEFISAMKRLGCMPVKRYPHKDPIFGLDLLFATKRNIEKGVYLQENQKRYEVHGRTFQILSSGKPIIHTIEPENVKTILATSFPVFGSAPLRRGLAYQLCGKGILSEDGAYWQHSRALIRPTFTRTQVADLELFQPHVDSLIDAIPRDGGTVELQQLFKHYILDTSSEFLLGESVNSQLPSRPADVDRFLEAFEYASSNMGKARHLPKLLFWRKDEKFIEATKTVHAFIDKHVARALKQKEKLEMSKEDPFRFILLDAMAQQTNDPVELRHQILHVFIPGHESTGVLLASIFYLLARHPEVWKKLRAEILAGPEKPTYESIKNNKYLIYVINEVLRLETPFFAGTRISLEPTTLPLGGGPSGRSPIYLPKDQVVAFDIRALHRDKELWGPDAEEFKPERWATARPTWEYIPFNGGPRLCLAQQLVLMEAGYVVTRLLMEFQSIESRDSKPWTEQLKLTVRNKNGVKVMLKAA